MAAGFLTVVIIKPCEWDAHLHVSFRLEALIISLCLNLNLFCVHAARAQTHAWKRFRSVEQKGN